MSKLLIFRTLISCAFVVFLTACSTLDNSVEPVESVSQLAKTPPRQSAAPLTSVSESDVLFAQTALSQLGYKLGSVDGIWGSQSVIAMRAFEEKEKIESANGKLSKLNLYTLSKATKVLRSSIVKKVQPSAQNAAQETPNTIMSKLNSSAPLQSSPQLIILDAPYPVLAKANPYSEVVTTLKAGTGVYILNRQGEWFEIESLERERGFIKENP